MSDPPVVQRWRQRRDVYRPAGEPIDTRRYEVAAMAGDRTAKDFVLAHHYSGSYPAARFRFGLHRGEHLVGVAVFSHPCNNAVLTGTFSGAEPLQCVELGWFVLLDEVPANGESWMLGRCFELLRREGIVGIVSFADPEPRACATGTVVFGGHVGTIYQATNGIYPGPQHAAAAALATGRQRALRARDCQAPRGPQGLAVRRRETDRGRGGRISQ
jgi:hypothetical protein